MITSTNPVVANALGINSGFALNARKIGESREWAAAKRAWGKATYALADLEQHLRKENQAYAAKELAQTTNKMGTCIDNLGRWDYE